ncbi:hypothetical protein SNE40_007804 [Patella caerulea]|uniref:Large ribosomal subunit protein bL35m n=1 Tax=Patella caerulea TaxID=87958 RepID=A0AAN8Q2U8_PATCE
MSASMSSKVFINCGRRLLQQSNTHVLTNPNLNTIGNLPKLFQRNCSLHSGVSNILTCVNKSRPATPIINNLNYRSLTTLTRSSECNILTRPILQIQTPQIIPCRTKIRFSMKKGKPKTVKAVVQRFYRLDWGAWIRTRSGRGKKLWRKSPARKYRLRQHVFCTKNQSKLLSAMVTNYWKRPRHYADDPYAPYHKRTNFNETPVQKPPFLP